MRSVRAGGRGRVRGAAGVVALTALLSAAATLPTVVPAGASEPTVALVVGALGGRPLADVLNGEGIEQGSVTPIRATRVEVPASKARRVAERLRRAGARYVEPELLYRASGQIVPNDPLFSLPGQPELTQARVDRAWAVSTGAPGVVVAVVDTGVTVNSELVDLVPPPAGSAAGAPASKVPAVLTGYDFVNERTSTTDDDGHGTMVATVVAGRGNNGFGGAGVCWACRILPVKVLDSRGVGTSVNIARGIVYATDRGASIINLSLGGPGQSTAVDDAVAYARSRDVVVVAAAGNDGQSTPFPQPTASQFPANSPGALSVGSVTAAGSIHPDSSRGAAWVQVAAANSVVAVGADDKGYLFSGTSAATPLVAGTAALVRAVRPGWSAATVTDAITGTARPVTPAGGMSFGLIDAEAAVNRAAPPPPPPNQPPSATVEPPGAFLAGTATTAVVAGDDTGVAEVRLLVNGQDVGAATGPGPRYQVSWSTGAFPDGPVSLTAVVRDVGGLSAESATVSRVIDNNAPTTAVWGPAGSTQSNTFPILVGARDGGTGTRLTLVAADGRWVGAFAGDGGRFLGVPVTRNGPFSIAAVSVDNAGRVAISNVITVNGRLVRPVVAGRTLSRRR